MSRLEEARYAEALRGSAASVLLALTRRLPLSAVSAHGDEALLAQWANQMRY